MVLVISFFETCWTILLEAGIWLLFGFTIAGVLHVLIPAMSLAKYLRGNGFRPTLSAVLLGAPIPLCSCSVLPVAKALRDGGAGRGPTAGFLISAPETGADAITLSWALLGPIWAIVRPIAAILTAMTAGMLQPKDATDYHSQQAANGTDESKDDDCCDDCHDHTEQKPDGTFREKVVDALKYAFIEQPTDLARYLLPGILMAAVITMVFPPASLATYGHGFPVYVAAILIGLPLYICSTASTPLAAGLLAAGVAPGPILTFMLVGPATNVTSFAAVRKLLGAQGLAIQLIVVTGVAVFCGMVLDAIYSQYSEWFTPRLLLVQPESMATTEEIGAIVLVGLLTVGLYRDFILKKR